MIYGCLIAHFTLSLNIYSSLCTPQLIPDMRRRSVQSARLTLEAKSGFSHYWFTFTIFSARLSNWNSSRQIRQPLLCLTYFQQKVIFLTIFCFWNSVCFERIVKHWWGDGGLAVLANLSQDFLRLFLQPTTLYRESDWNFCPDFFTTDQSGSIKFLSWLEYIRRKDMHTWSTQCVSHTTKNVLKY